MERQSSFGSQSSAGSALTSRSATAKIVKDAEKDQGLDNQGQNLLTALFGALYTLAKEKINDTASIAMLAIWVDFLLIFTLILMPEYPWKVDKYLWIYKIFYYIQIHLPLVDTGYTFYLIIFYMLVAVLYASVVICIWVGWCFMNDNFPFLWPIKVARVVVSLFVSMFYIAALNIFLMACACKKVDSRWEHLVFHVDCLGFPHIIHASFSIASGVVFFLVAFLLVLGDHELEPMSKSLLAAPHSMCELRALLCKTVITIADILFKPLPHVQVILYTLACGLIFYYHARMVPHYVPWINVLRGGLNMVLAWVALMACILTYTVHWEIDHGHPTWDRPEYRAAMTTVMAVGVPVCFFLGGGICWGHLVYAWKSALKFKNLPPGVKPRTIHRFTTEFDVEIASRIGRVWDEEGVFDPTALDLAENVLKAGVAMKPNSVFMHIAYSNFLIDVRHNMQSGWNHLEHSKKLEPNLSYQFSIFTRIQEHKQKAGGGGTEGSTDLVSYVEFQKNYRSLLVYHKASLVANREFWRLLTRDTIPLERLGHSFKRIDEMEFMAEKTYKLVLDRYPTNAKLLKSYGKFLENVKNDPWGAARYYAEAEKQEELAENAAADVRIADAEGLAGMLDDQSALITIDATGTIQTVNRACIQMLGYKKGELEGKNVSCIMPAPFSLRHNTYIRNYVNTGKEKILNSMLEVVALHKDRHVFPVSTFVTKLNGSGADSIFMGVIKPMEVDPNTIRAWLLTSGTMLCADQSFLDYAGWEPDELVGKAFSSLGVDSGELDELIARCASCDEFQLKDGAVELSTSIKHKYADSVPVHIKFEMGGTEGQRILVAVMTRLADNTAMASFDSKGRCLYANTPLATLLGYKLPVLRSKDISQLLPPPYGALHMKWLKDADHMEAKQTPGSCRNGLTSIMLSANGAPTFVKTTIIPHNPAGSSQGFSFSANGAAAQSDTIWAIKVDKSSQAQLLNERRVQLLVSAEGRIIWTTPSSPTWLFGHEPSTLVGTKLSSVIDIFTEYEGDDPTADVTEALAALVSRNTSRPGSSWRVGVGKNLQPKDLLEQQVALGAGTAAITQGKSLLEGLKLHRAAKDRIKPAILTVTIPTEETVSEEVLTAAAGQEAVVYMELWRADLLLGVAEVSEDCSFARVEPTVGLLFGLAHTSLFQTNLSQWVRLPPDTQLADLLGTQGAKKGGMRKSSRMQRFGPSRTVTGLHADRRPVQIILQATIKDGTADDKLVLSLKLTAPARGAAKCLATLIAAEAAGQGSAGVDSLGNAAVLGGLSSGLESGAGLMHDKFFADSNELMNTNTFTQQSAAGENAVATLRAVDVDLEDTNRTEHGHGRTPARLASSPRDDRHHKAASHGRQKHGGHGRVGFEGSESNPASDDEGYAGAKDMALSDDDSDEGEQQRHGKKGMKKVKKHLTEEEEEAIHEAKGAKKAKEWLDSEFGGFKKEDDEPGMSLPGAVDGSEAPFQLVQGRGGRGAGKSRGSEPATDEIPTAGEEKVATEGAASELSDTIPADGALVSDFTRGKRLRKLMRLLSSKAAMQVVTGFRFKVLMVVAFIIVLHIGSFGAIVGYIAKATSYLTDLTAAGDVVDYMHRTATLSLVLEAAQRGYGFLPSDTAKYAEQMKDLISKFDKMHQGLYLGFDGLRSLDTPELYKLWHQDSIMSTSYQDATDLSRVTTTGVSLFNLGSTYGTAAQDVLYAALNPDSQQAEGVPLAQNRQWLFIQANGPGALYPAYLKSLNYMVLRAQENVTVLQKAVLALLIIEGLLVLVLAVGLVARLLKGISVHRQALFSVFLAIPNSYLRTLASRSINIGEEGDEDEEEEKAIQQAEEKKRKSKKAKQAKVEETERMEGAKSTGPRKASFMVGDAGDGAAYVGLNSAGPGKFKNPGSNTYDPHLDRQKLFNGKQLSTSAQSAYQLAWPFLLWGMLVMILYGISYKQFGDINAGIIAIKMSQLSLAQASRMTYYGARISLEPSATKRAELQSVLWQESKKLDKVYHTALYGGPTLEDSQADGSMDTSSGNLFVNPHHKYLLFETQACLRQDQSGCLAEDDAFYVVSRHGVDPMVQRLSQEAELLSLESAAEINPQPTSTRCLEAGYPLQKCRFACIWSVTWEDLHDGLKQLGDMMIKETSAAYSTQQTIHVILVLIMVGGDGAFLVSMLRPFLKHVSKESRRCAELLAQLPSELDVEGMIAATWSVVKEERILAERSGRTFIDALGGSIMRGLSFMSGTYSRHQDHVMALTGGPTPRGTRYPDGERLFSPRQAVDSEQGDGSPRRQTGPSGARFVGDYSTGNNKASGYGARGEPSPRRGPGPRGARFEDGRRGGEDSQDEMQNSVGLGKKTKGNDSLRLRHVGHKSPSKRAVYPVDDEDY